MDRIRRLPLNGSRSRPDLVRVLPMGRQKGRWDTGFDGVQRAMIEPEVVIMRMMSRVVASIAAASGLAALVGVILVSRLDPCTADWDWQTRLSELLFSFDLARGWALLSVALAAAVGCAIAALVIGASLDVRHGIAATVILIACVTGAAVAGVALGTVLRGCEPIVAGEIRDALVPVGIAALVGAVPGYLVGLAIAAARSHRSRPD